MFFTDDLYVHFTLANYLNSCNIRVQTSVGYCLTDFEIDNETYIHGDKVDLEKVYEHNLNECVINCPTQEGVLRYLRDVFNVFIDVRFNRVYQTYKYYIYSMDEDAEDMYEFIDVNRTMDYKQIVDDAIVHAVNDLINTGRIK